MPTYLTRPIPRAASTEYYYTNILPRCNIIRNDDEDAPFLSPEDSKRLRRLIEEKIHKKTEPSENCKNVEVAREFEENNDVPKSKLLK